MAAVRPQWDGDAGTQALAAVRAGHGFQPFLLEGSVSGFRGAIARMRGEIEPKAGYDRLMKANTVKTRTHSLFRQGCMLYELIPMMPEPRLRPLLQRFGDMLLEIPAFAGVYGAI